MTPADIDHDTALMLANIVTDDAKRRAERFGLTLSLERIEQLAADRQLTQAGIDRALADVNAFCGF
jgi:hypothetical protein